MSIEISNVVNQYDFFAILRAIDIVVPRRVDGRTTNHVETWTICRLLSTLANTGVLRFPVCVKHRDRPDFFVADANGEIGVEVTEAVSEQYAAYCALAEREFPSVFLDPSHFRWRSSKLNTAQMRELLKQTRLSGEPWVGDGPEQEWALFMFGVVDAKLKKMDKSDFQIYQRNILAIYDNLPLPNVHLDKAIARLLPMIANRWSASPSFNTIYIEHGPVVAELSPHSSRNLLLNDLWP